MYSAVNCYNGFTIQCILIHTLLELILLNQYAEQCIIQAQAWIARATLVNTAHASSAKTAIFGTGVSLLSCWGGVDSRQVGACWHLPGSVWILGFV